MAEEDTIKELGSKFAEKNPTFIRTIMEHHWTKGSYETSQGRVTRWEFEAKAKQI